MIIHTKEVKREFIGSTLKMGTRLLKEKLKLAGSSSVFVPSSI